ncbi:hypothetical protein TRVA0_099S00188 [Trichomonascus vanleenenianus]|uniref:uncharacterized protein n=1 Tax=Trichomonascus vanleenenianus TaxID=2268995 RepID=UPI003ECB9D54
MDRKQLPPHLRRSVSSRPSPLRQLGGNSGAVPKRRSDDLLGWLTSLRLRGRSALARDEELESEIESEVKEREERLRKEKEDEEVKESSSFQKLGDILFRYYKKNTVPDQGQVEFVESGFTPGKSDSPQRTGLFRTLEEKGQVEDQEDHYSDADEGHTTIYSDAKEYSEEKDEEVAEEDKESVVELLDSDEEDEIEENEEEEEEEEGEEEEEDEDEDEGFDHDDLGAEIGYAQYQDGFSHGYLQPGKPSMHHKLAEVPANYDDFYGSADEEEIEQEAEAIESSGDLGDMEEEDMEGMEHDVEGVDESLAFYEDHYFPIHAPNSALVHDQNNMFAYGDLHHQHHPQNIGTNEPGEHSDVPASSSDSDVIEILDSEEEEKHSEEEGEHSEEEDEEHSEEQGEEHSKENEQEHAMEDEKHFAVEAKVVHEPNIAKPSSPIPNITAIFSDMEPTAAMPEKAFIPAPPQPWSPVKPPLENRPEKLPVSPAERSDVLTEPHPDLATMVKRSKPTPVTVKSLKELNPFVSAADNAPALDRYRTMTELAANNRLSVNFSFGEMKSEGKTDDFSEAPRKTLKRNFEESEKASSPREFNPMKDVSTPKKEPTRLMPTPVKFVGFSNKALNKPESPNELPESSEPSPKKVRLDADYSGVTAEEVEEAIIGDVMEVDVTVEEVEVSEIAGKEASFEYVEHHFTVEEIVEEGPQLAEDVEPGTAEIGDEMVSENLTSFGDRDGEEESENTRAETESDAYNEADILMQDNPASAEEQPLEGIIEAVESKEAAAPKATLSEENLSEVQDEPEKPLSNPPIPDEDATIENEQDEAAKSVADQEEDVPSESQLRAMEEAVMNEIENESIQDEEDGNPVSQFPGAPEPEPSTAEVDPELKKDGKEALNRHSDVSQSGIKSAEGTTISPPRTRSRAKRTGGNGRYEDTTLEVPNETAKKKGTVAKKRSSKEMLETDVPTDVPLGMRTRSHDSRENTKEDGTNEGDESALPPRVLRSGKLYDADEASSPKSKKTKSTKGSGSGSGSRKKTRRTVNLNRR